MEIDPAGAEDESLGDVFGTDGRVNSHGDPEQPRLPGGPAYASTCLRGARRQVADRCWLAYLSA